MKCISFSAVDVLPALLNKKKVQTIRPAWKEGIKLGCVEAIPKSTLPSGDIVYNITLKLARLEVGDKVKLYWNQRSKSKIFCRMCGHAPKLAGQEKIQSYDWFCPICNLSLHEGLCFNKLLGTAIISDVFKIEMHKIIDRLNIQMWLKGINKELSFSERNIIIPKLDGFYSFKIMFNWFDKKYDLSSPKQFWVYRWRYIK